MSDPLKPRIDFATPLNDKPNDVLRPAQTFDAEARNAFLAVAESETAVEEGSAGERAVEAALKPKRSLWRNMVGAGWACLGSASWRRACSGATTPGWRTTGLRWAAGWPGD